MIGTIVNNILQDRNLSGNSSWWANWQSELSPYTCLPCAESHGKIVLINILDSGCNINAHLNCRCIYVPMRTLLSGKATDIGMNGADAYLIYFGKLPDYYISKMDAKTLGWESWKGNLDVVLPGKMLGGDIYRNDDEKLPRAPGRVWREADINYSGGYRNRERILYSNDGLVFVSYDHYQTFYEITR